MIAPLLLAMASLAPQADQDGKDWLAVWDGEQFRIASRSVAYMEPVAGSTAGSRIELSSGGSMPVLTSESVPNGSTTSTTASRSSP